MKNTDVVANQRAAQQSPGPLGQHHARYTSMTATEHLSTAEQLLVDLLRQYEQIERDRGYDRSGWAFHSVFHLLLKSGRLFTPAPRPPDVPKLPDRWCYANATQTAHAHPDRGLMYAEGYSMINAGAAIPLPHAWCVTPEGTVIDPTWHDNDGIAYYGIAVADPQLWPTDGGGLLSDAERSIPLLRNGLNEDAYIDVGKSLSWPRN